MILKKQLKNISKSQYSLDIILLLLLIILSSIIIFNNLGESSLFADEAIYAQAERDAAEKNSWLPLYAGETVFLYKPPLKIWAVALIFKYFGVNEFNARVLDALFGIATIALVFVFGRIFFNRKVGFIAALLLLTADKYISLYDSLSSFGNGVRAGVMESWFVFFISVSLFLYLYYFNKEQTNKKLLCIVGTFMGAALLVKGVIAFMIVAIICIFKFVFSHKQRFMLSTYYDTFFISTLALVLYLPWFFLMNVSTKWAYFYYMHDDLFVRATTALDPFHIHGLLFYIGSIVLDFRVWIIFLLLVPFIVIGSKNQAGIHKYYFLLTWILVVFIGFSIPISKLVWYVYPLYPALALLLAYNVDISFAFFKKLGHFYKLAFIGFITIILLIGLILVFLNSENVKVIGVHKFVKIYEQQKNPQFFIDPALNYFNLTRQAWTDFYLDKVSDKTEGIPKTNKNSCIFLLTENKNRIQKVPANSQIKLEFFAINKSEAYILNFCMNKPDKS